MPSSTDLNYQHSILLAEEIIDTKLSKEEAASRIFTELQVAQKRGEIIFELDIEESNFTIVESPLRGHPDGYEAGKAYAQCCLKHSALKMSETPWASHLLYTQILDDTIPEERDTGIGLHINIIQMASVVPGVKMAVYKDYGISKGMELAIKLATNLNIEIQERYIV